MKTKALVAIEGDFMTGTRDRDVFILREGGGNEVVSGFDLAKDKVMLDFNSYSDVLGPFGHFYDGQEFTDFTGLTHITVTATDLNADGVTDTVFTVNGADSITLLGISPEQLAPGYLMGG